MTPQHGEIVKHSDDGFTVAWDTTKRDAATTQDVRKVVAERASELRELFGCVDVIGATPDGVVLVQVKANHGATKRTVTPRHDGWSVQKPGASRASSVHDTRQEAIDAARGYLRNEGGGELVIEGHDSRVRAQDTRGDTPRGSRA